MSQDAVYTGNRSRHEAESGYAIDEFMKKRLAIARKAAKHIGAHYVRGGAGATPGGNDGAWYRPGLIEWVAPEIDKPAQAMVCAASCTITERHVCPGRYAAIQGGRTFKPADGDLLNYLASLKEWKESGRPQALWPNYFGFTPRVANWKTPGGIASERVWGEDCTGIRHFDCIGFVNYVLKDAGVRSAGHRDISHYFTYTHERDKTRPMPGDIVTIGDHHIGVIYDANSVVQAAEGPRGVIKSKYSPGSWTRLGRIADKDL